LEEIQGLALRDPFQNIHHDNVGQTFGGETDRATGADIS
jgi:hypothetical protein